uniref:Uncharacterized protein n=1 Tax=Avena sativa TaxID=4498 RepID=A0ACD5YX25_AVESA
MGQKPALAYSTSTDSEGERDEDDDFNPTRKRRCPAGSKFAKNSKDDNFVPMVPDADGRKKHARVQARRHPAFKRTSGVQDNFPGEYPTFTKRMVPSNVLRVFWLHLSNDFCRTYLPKCDARMTLEDEDGRRDYANYLSGSYGLSGGWRGFATNHSLKVGDTVVFELVMPTIFKVYIRRENDSTLTDDDIKSKERTEVTGASSSAPDDVANKVASEEAVGDVDGMRYPNPAIEIFDGVPSFKNFNILIDGLPINPELFPDCLRGTYYELCCDRKVLLHRNLLKNIPPTLVVGVIMETANIAKGISPSASPEDLAAWKKILESFELLGMDVGFLRKSVNDFLGITAKSSTDQSSVECEGYEEVKLEKDRAEEKMRTLKSKMATVKEAMRAVDVEMEEMESSSKKNFLFSFKNIFRLDMTAADQQNKNTTNITAWWRQIKETMDAPRARNR